MKPIFVNGRFSHAPLTGVQRHAQSVLSRLGNVNLVSPSRLSRGALGHAWEQSLLLNKTRQGVLWSPANTGPVFHPCHAVTLHDCAVFDVPESFTQSFATWYRSLLPPLVDRAQVVLTVSEFSKERIQEYLKVPAEKIVVSGNGVSSEFSTIDEIEINKVRARFKLDFPYFLCVGSEDPRKNLPLLLRVAHIMDGKGYPHFVFVGGASPQVFAKTDLTQASSNVHFLGSVDDSALPALYSGAEAFLFPSRYEGFGLPALEAMACGTPVLVSSLPSLKEIVGEAGYYFPELNEEGIVDTIESFCGDSTYRNRLSAEGLKRAAKFSWEGPTEIVQGVLDKLAT